MVPGAKRPDDTATLGGETADALTLGALEPAGRWGLVILHSPGKTKHGREVPLEAPLRIGREGGLPLDLALADRRVSRTHAVVRQQEGGYEICDLGSHNGTFVNGKRRERALLEAGAVIRVGDTVMAFEALPEVSLPDDPELVGRSRALCGVRRHIDRVAGSEIPVLILGETGTGKEVVARRIHAISGRRGPFVAVNCASIPPQLTEATLFGHQKGSFTGATSDAEGFFGSAADGTLFLDEVGELQLECQPKLLRVLDTREYVPVGAVQPRHTDACIIAATNAFLEAEAAAGAFRLDLFARLAGFVIRVPPLSARRSDIPLLAEHFLHQQEPSREIGWTAGFIEKLALFDWPLNVRGLRLVMQRLGLLGVTGPLRAAHLRGVLEGLELSQTSRHSRADAAQVQRQRTATRPTREELCERLTQLKGNIALVARSFGKDPKQIYRWLDHFGLNADGFRGQHDT